MEGPENILRLELYGNRSGEARKDDLDLQEVWALSKSGLSSGLGSHRDWASAHLAMCSAYLAIVKYGPSTFAPSLLSLCYTMRVEVQLWANRVNT